MTNDDPTVQPDPAVARRALFRGGAMLAGAAGISAIGAAVAAPAEAADGDALTVGVANDAESTTGLTIGAAVGSGEAALSLTNADGPSLYLNPLADDWNDQLSPGQIANTTRGPLIGIVQDGEGRNAALLTDQDVWIPFVLPQPMRLVDTRTVLGRQRVTLPSPLTSDGRLPAGEALTFWIAPTEEGFGIPAIHLNITVVKPKSAGYVVVYPGPDRPDNLDGELPQRKDRGQLGVHVDIGRNIPGQCRGPGPAVGGARGDRGEDLHHGNGLDHRRRHRRLRHWLQPRRAARREPSPSGQATSHAGRPGPAKVRQTSMMGSHPRHRGRFRSHRLSSVRGGT